MTAPHPIDYALPGSRTQALKRLLDGPEARWWQMAWRASGEALVRLWERTTKTLKGASNV